MNGYHRATNFLALAAAVLFLVLALIGSMSWVLALVGAAAVNCVAAYYTKGEEPPE